MTHASPPPGSVAPTQVVFSWGAGEDGQLGLEEASTGSDEWHVAHPVPVPALAGLAFRGDTPAGGVHQAVVGGSRQSLCVTGDGALYCWGWNEKHALGLGHRNEVKQPHRVELPPGVHVQQVRVLWARRQRGGVSLEPCGPHSLARVSCLPASRRLPGEAGTALL
jgi:alpha-tubulin suppressor-like RCC1 family protein